MKKILILIAIVSLMIFTGCGEEGTEIDTTRPYIGGTEGLKMSFVPSMPPDFVFDNGGYEFGIGVQVDNDGEDDVEADEATVEIKGINPSDFNLNSQQDLKHNLNGPLNGAQKNFEGTELPGGRDVVEFSGLNYVRDEPGNFGVKIRAELCYRYQTYTSTKLCIKKRLLGASINQEICEAMGEKNPVNSGSPVHITSLKETPMGDDKIQMAFVIENVGTPKGIIFDRNAPECDDAVNNAYLNKVWISVNTDVDNVYPVCQGLMEGDSHSGYVTMYSGEPRTVTCTLDLSHIDSIFEKAFEITLDYKYLQYMDTPLEIRDVSTSG